MPRQVANAAPYVCSPFPSFAVSPSFQHQHHHPNIRDLSQLQVLYRYITKKTHAHYNHVSRRWYHALRHWLRPRHPRSRPRLRIRTVRFLSLAQLDRRPSPHRPLPAAALYALISRYCFGGPFSCGHVFLPSQLPSRARIRPAPPSLFPQDPLESHL